MSTLYVWTDHISLNNSGVPIQPINTYIEAEFKKDKQGQQTATVPAGIVIFNPTKKIQLAIKSG